MFFMYMNTILKKKKNVFPFKFVKKNILVYTYTEIPGKFLIQRDKE